MKILFDRKRRKLYPLYRVMRKIGKAHRLSIPQVAMCYVSSKGIVPVCGCGTGPMISLLYEEDPAKHYTGLDITPRMIEVAKAKNLAGVSWVVGDCENLPFEDNMFGAVICSNSFHHYPIPQKFFDSEKKTGSCYMKKEITYESRL